MSGLINQSSSHADEDIGAQPSVRFSRTKEQFDIQQDTEFFVVKQVESRNVFSAEGEEVANLRDISDINSTAISAGIGTNFILTYDATEDNFKFISPDALVDSAVGPISGPIGFSTTVINNLVDTLDVQLDDKIDLDAGTWS
tara:strand:- start:3982 stop:4407 length:426 start_codon:yes stop_codon:yes gene_type:complete